MGRVEEGEDGLREGGGRVEEGGWGGIERRSRRLWRGWGDTCRGGECENGGGVCLAYYF